MTKQDKQNFDHLIKKHNQILDKEYNSKRITLSIPLDQVEVRVKELTLKKYTTKKSYGIDFNYYIDIILTYFYSPINKPTERRKGVIVVPIDKW